MFSFQIFFTLGKIIFLTKLIYVFFSNPSPSNLSSPVMLSKQGIFHLFKSLPFFSLHFSLSKYNVKVKKFLREILIFLYKQIRFLAAALSLPSFLSPPFFLNFISKLDLYKGSNTNWTELSSTLKQ